MHRALVMYTIEIKIKKKCKKKTALQHESTSVSSSKLYFHFQSRKWCTTTPMENDNIFETENCKRKRISMNE